MISKTVVALSLLLVASLVTPLPRQKRLDRISKANWMSNVPDEQSLAHMTIPGTHDSGALGGTRFAQCQSMNISDQLKYGIRFLDIRCDVKNNDSFVIHHGMISEHMDFEQILDQCLGFLTANPSEAILMSVKQEYSDVPEAVFVDIFNQYMAAKYQSGTYGDWMYYAVHGAVPTLQQIRGKVVIVSRVDGLPGIQWSHIDIQDDFNLAEIGTSGKWTIVQKQLEKAAKEHDSGSQKLFVNFASGIWHSRTKWPKSSMWILIHI